MDVLFVFHFQTKSTKEASSQFVVLVPKLFSYFGLSNIFLCFSFLGQSSNNVKFLRSNNILAFAN